ncbi:hypothetical protein DFA_08027 [Cavenderia fasciculata]|uniref:Uncharacterized protein n=1 Tax=Cavenderia fasciculata TaxID=261658 RepID=F4Q4N7_CACFS|nr:uncharacterized protein DFA_08027 [Cavenderia fasciculata]EGG17046.1 hypothetical protein DFA_08027 [Cavenderia fasciculata]|eukprot:XP_004355530.1 hypothetical protein DFA_08027 [Cavenderia fasciculata]
MSTLPAFSIKDKKIATEGVGIAGSFIGFGGNTVFALTKTHTEIASFGIDSNGSIGVTPVETVPYDLAGGKPDQLLVPVKLGNHIYLPYEVNDEEFVFTIMKVSNSQISEINKSKKYIFGRARPTFLHHMTEWSRIGLGQPPQTYVKVDLFDFVNQQGEFVCAFRPIEGEMIVQSGLTNNFQNTGRKLVSVSFIDGSRVVHIRKYNEQSKLADEILETWSWNDGLFNVESDPEYVLVYAQDQIIVFSLANNSKWSIDFEKPLVHAGKVVRIGQVLLHHCADNSGVYVDMIDMSTKSLIKTIRIPDAPGISPLAIHACQNNTCLLIAYPNNQIFSLTFTD